MKNNTSRELSIIGYFMAKTDGEHHFNIRSSSEEKYRGLNGETPFL
jgi:hypothetical protein